MAALVRVLGLWRLCLIIRVDSLEQEGFLADVESGRFGVEVLELRPEPCWGLLLLLECIALGDSAGAFKTAALCGDCLVPTGSLTCQ